MTKKLLEYLGIFALTFYLSEVFTLVGGIGEEKQLSGRRMWGSGGMG